MISPSRSLRITWRDDLIQLVLANVGSKNLGLYLLFIESYLALLLDSPHDSDKPIRIIYKFFTELVTNDARTLIVRYSSLADAITQTMDSTSDYAITGEFQEGMKKTPIFREYLHFFRTGDASCLQFILSFLYFGKKMDFVDVDLESAAFRDWSEIEDAMGNFSIPTAITDCLRIIMMQLLPDIDDTLCLPKNGPGYTSEGFIDPNEKLDNVSFDEKSRYAFRPNSFGRVGLDRQSVLNYSGRLGEQVAKLKFVPKNVKTMRSICMEPISRMLLQQEVARWVIDASRKTSFGAIVTLTDQSHNRRYALHGSYSQSCDTIDLSAASDRLHVDLVRRIFPKKVLFYLLGTRTNRVNVGTGIRVLNKFAPMGSALCFPIQCAVFTAITLLAYLKYAYECGPEEDPSIGWPLLHHIDDFVRSMHTEPAEIQNLLRPRVYGDDIICDFRVTDGVLALLTQCGLAVNTQKSFIGGTPFRESCGIFAYNGEDVTPYLFRVPSLGALLSAKVLASVMDGANRAGDFHYNHLRSCFIHFLKRSHVGGVSELIESFIPFTTSREDFGIFTLSPHRPKMVRYNERYQRDEKRVLVLRSVCKQRRESQLMEQYAYDQWVRARIRSRSTEDNFSVLRIRPSVTRVRLGWTPA